MITQKEKEEIWKTQQSILPEIKEDDIEKQYEEETGHYVCGMFMNEWIRWLKNKIKGERKRYKRALGMLEVNIRNKEKKRILKIIDEMITYQKSEYYIDFINKEILIKQIKEKSNE